MWSWKDKQLKWVGNLIKWVCKNKCEVDVLKKY